MGLGIVGGTVNDVVNVGPAEAAVTVDLSAGLVLGGSRRIDWDLSLIQF